LEESTKTALSYLSDGGSFLFTSSGGVFSANDGQQVDEESPVKADQPYYARILAAEKVALSAGGCALRLGGLYTLTRGAHNYWMRTAGKSEFPSSPNGLINLIHYDDAARAVVLALRASLSGLFVASDGEPISRLDICRAAKLNVEYANFNVPNFAGQGVDGKKYKVDRIREAMKEWKPKHESFHKFMSETFALQEPVPLLGK